MGLNSVGLKRRGFTPKTVKTLKHAFHLIFRSRLQLQDALAKVRSELATSPEVARLLQFLEKSDRGFCR